MKEKEREENTMTNVSYILTNGTEVKSLREAQLSGQGYTATYRPVPKAPVNLTEKQKANRVKI